LERNDDEADEDVNHEECNDDDVDEEEDGDALPIVVYRSSVLAVRVDTTIHETARKKTSHGRKIEVNNIYINISEYQCCLRDSLTGFSEHYTIGNCLFMQWVGVDVYVRFGSEELGEGGGWW